MITTINEFRQFNESNNWTDEQRAEKLEQIIELGREMISNYRLSEESAEFKSEKNAEVAELLQRLNKTSVIAEGVLIEVYKPFTQKRLSNKAYFDFVNNSVGVINQDFIVLSDAVRTLSTKLTGASSHIRMTHNTRDIETGTMKTTESLSGAWESIKSWFDGFKNRIMGMLPNMESELDEIKKQSAQFSVVTESVGNNASNYVLEDIVDGFLQPYITEMTDYRLDHDGNTVMLYIPIDDVKFDIKDQHSPEWNILNLAFQEFCNEHGLYDFEVTTTDGYTDLVFSADTDTIDVRNPRYESKVNEIMSDDQRARRNATSKASHAKRRQQNKAIADVLTKAKEAIGYAEDEEYFLDLAVTKEKALMAMLAEFSAKSIVIDDKILTLVNIAAKETLDMKEYIDKITNAEEVGNAVAKMSQALMEMHKSVINVSGSTRHISDTSDSPDGTFNAHFDHETKTVVTPTTEGAANESAGSFIAKIWDSIKMFFKSFKRASKEADNALAAI